MTSEEIIAGVLEREGGYTEDAADAGNANSGATNFGITSAAFGVYKQLNRPATRAEIKAITPEQAAEFYRRQYIERSPFASIAYEPLRNQLIDFSINSGTARAIRWLQRCLDVPASGVFDNLTQGALSRDRLPLVNKALIAARLYMIDAATDHGTIAKKYEEGIESRALGFSDFSGI